MQQTTSLGEVPALDWVDVSLIDVDRTYQRDADGQNVKKIVRGFRWDRFGAVVLAPQLNGRYHVTDGQHRVLAAQAHPAVTHVPAVLIDAVGTKPEAQNFLAINLDRKGVTALDKFWAGVAAEDALCLRVKSVVASADCEIMRRPGGATLRASSAVGALSRAAQSYGDRAAKEALVALCEAWPADPLALRGQMILSVAKLIEGNPQIAHQRLARIIGAKSFTDIASAADGMRQLSGGTSETAFARVIAEMYNRGSPKKIAAGGGA